MPIPASPSCYTANPMRRAWTVLKYALAAFGAYLLIGLFLQRANWDYWRNIWR